MGVEEEFGTGCPSDAELEPYIGMSREEIARLVLCLLAEETLRGRLAPFRSGAQYLAAEPVESREKLLVARDDVVPVCHRAG